MLQVVVHTSMYRQFPEYIPTVNRWSHPSSYGNHRKQKIIFNGRHRFGDLSITPSQPVERGVPKSQSTVNLFRSTKQLLSRTYKIDLAPLVNFIEFYWMYDDVIEYWMNPKELCSKRWTFVTMATAPDRGEGDTTGERFHSRWTLSSLGSYHSRFTLCDSYSQ